MIFVTEKKLRRIFQEEFERFMNGEKIPDSDSYSIKAANGAEIIMPNPVREMFNEGRVTSVKDILHE